MILGEEKLEEAIGSAWSEGVIDTHAHLAMRQFDTDRENVIQRAWDAGLEAIVTIGAGNGIEGNAATVRLAERHEKVFATVGMHPHDASKWNDEAFAALGTLSRHEKVVAVGETGLDLHYMLSPKTTQIECFRTQLRFAKDVGLPVIIHTREAATETLEILGEEGIGPAGGVIHCFSGDRAEARAYLKLGYMLSFTGIVSFPKAGEVRETARETPTERVLVETDAPYLAPVPLRGRRNEPACVRLVARSLAGLTGLSEDDVARLTTMNARRLFGIGDVADLGKIAYKIRDSLYHNITNRCTNACVFCPKRTTFAVKGHYLKLGREPDVEEIMAATTGIDGYSEVVFCGFGEPLLRMDAVKTVAARMKDRGLRTRVNTDGQANLVHGRNVLVELEGLIDAISVSLNSNDPTQYVRITGSPFGTRACEAVKEFIREANRHIPEVAATVVGMEGVDVEACRRLVEEELGARFRVRRYNHVG